MSQIPDYTEAEISIVRTSANNRWKKESIDLQLADVEVQLDPKTS